MMMKEEKTVLGQCLKFCHLEKTQRVCTKSRTYMLYVVGEIQYVT